MAKKSKRPIRREANAVPSKPAAESALSGRSTSFIPDYHYVIKDIRRVGILAGSFILVLVVLAFFLH